MNIFNFISQSSNIWNECLHTKHAYYFIKTHSTHIHFYILLEKFLVVSDFTKDKLFLILVHSGPSSLSPRGRDYRQTQGSPRVSEDARHGRTNGHRQRAGSATPSIQSTISSSGGGKDSPSRSITSKSSNSRNTPTSGKMITREDLRRMNRSTPSTKKERQPTSFSRTSIPMS